MANNCLETYSPTNAVLRTPGEKDLEKYIES